MKTALTSLLLAVACAAGAAGTASADQRATSGSAFAVPFRYDRSELTTEAGQRAMLARMEKQVRVACIPAPREAWSNDPEAKKCIDTAMRQALRKINSESLASRYSSSAAG